MMNFGNSSGGMSFGTGGNTGFGGSMGGTNNMGGNTGFGSSMGGTNTMGGNTGFGSSMGGTTSGFGSNTSGGMMRGNSGFGMGGNSGGLNMGSSSFGMGGNSGFGMSGTNNSGGLNSGFGMGSSTTGMGNMGGGTGFFGNSNNMNSGYNTFGTSTSGMGSNTGNFQQNNLKNMSDDGSVEDLIQISQEYGFDRLKMQHCRLKSVTYEIMRQDAVAIQQGRVNRKPPYIEQSRWNQAKRKANQLTEKLNLSKGGERVVPRALVGFRQLREAIRQQDIHVDEIISQVGRLNTKVQKLKIDRRKIQEQIKSRLNSQVQLCHRLMHLMEQIAVRDKPSTLQ